MSPIALPTKPQTRAEIDPRQARFFLGGMPKSGKTTLLGSWAPATTLIIDTQHGTDLLEGEFWPVHVGSWADFVEAVTLICRGGHQFMTVGIDLIDDVWNLAGQEVASRLGIPAAALADYGKGTTEQEALFRREIGRLVATPLGIWFLSHVDEVEGKKVGRGRNQQQLPSRMVPRIDKRIRPWLTGLCHFVFLAETLTGKRQLRTTPTEAFEAGSRVPLPSPMPMDARELYKQILAGLRVAQPPAKPMAPAELAKRERRSDIPSDTPEPQTQLAAMPEPEKNPQEGDIAPPGSLEVDLPEGEPAEVLAFLRAQGCSCADPLKTMTAEGSLEEACPIAGHGVPWADDPGAERAAEAFAAPETEPTPADPEPVFADTAQIARLRSASIGLTGNAAKALLAKHGVDVNIGKGLWSLVPADRVDEIETAVAACPRPEKKPPPIVTPKPLVAALSKLAAGSMDVAVKFAFKEVGVDLPEGAKGDERFAHLTGEQAERLLEALS